MLPRPPSPRALAQWLELGGRKLEQKQPTAVMKGLAVKGVVVKGQDVERTVAEPMAGEAVNVVLWARHFVVDQARQSQADAKAFTGRGKHLELRLLLTELGEVEQYMGELAAASRAVPGHTMTLTLHTSNASGMRSLRWRSRVGAMKHLSWVEAADLVTQMPQPLADWYRQATAQCVSANARHRDLRRAIQCARDVVARSTPHLFPRRLAGQSL